jgi:hypothetical protein
LDQHAAVAARQRFGPEVRLRELGAGVRVVTQNVRNTALGGYPCRGRHA